MWMARVGSARCFGALAATLFGFAAVDALGGQTPLDRLYGESMRRAKQSASFADDEALARKMLETAGAAGTESALAVELCDAAYELAMAARAAEVAGAAMELRVALRPDRKREGLARQVEALELNYRLTRKSRQAAAQALMLACAELGRLELEAGDTHAIDSFRRAAQLASIIRSPRRRTFVDLIKQAQAARKTHEQIEALRESLKADPADRAAAERFVRLLLTQRADTAEARKYTFLLSDGPLKKNLSLARLAPGTLTLEQHLQLGDWYRSLRGDAPPHAARVLRECATAHYRHAMATVTPEQKLFQIKARLALAQMAEEAETRVADRAPPAAPPPPGIDLLQRVDLERHAAKGIWAAHDRGGIAGNTMSMLISPLTPRGDYELHLRVRLLEGADSFNVTLPVGEGHQVSYILGGYQNLGYLSLFQSIRGQSLEGETAHAPGPVKGFHLKPDRSHDLKLTVRSAQGRASIRVVVDGERFAAWEGDKTRLSLNAWGRTPRADDLAFAVSPIVPTRILLEEARLRMLSGEAVPSR